MYLQSKQRLKQTSKKNHLVFSLFIFCRFGSPISIGIYGHPAYEMSIFVLEVLKKSPNDINSVVKITDEVPENVMFETKQTDDNNSGQKTGTKIKNKKKVDKMAAKISGIFSLMEVFQLIFL